MNVALGSLFCAAFLALGEHVIRGGFRLTAADGVFAVFLLLAAAGSFRVRQGAHAERSTLRAIAVLAGLQAVGLLVAVLRAGRGRTFEVDGVVAIALLLLFPPVLLFLLLWTERPGFLAAAEILILLFGTATIPFSGGYA